MSSTSGLSQPPRDRWLAMAGVLSVHTILAFAILYGLAPQVVATVADQVSHLIMIPMRPLEAEQPHPHAVLAKQDAGKSGKMGAKAKATNIVAPKSAAVATPLPAATIPGSGTAPRSGASDVAATGSGAGGAGTGSGAGDDGSGGGGDAPPRWLKGRITDSDYPPSASEDRIGGTVSVTYLVGTDGRVSHCAVMHSSGNQALDATTCRLIEKRWRYAPSRDERGNAVEAEIDEEHEWIPRRDDREPGR